MATKVSIQTMCGNYINSSTSSSFASKLGQFHELVTSLAARSKDGKSMEIFENRFPRIKSKQDNTGSNLAFHHPNPRSMGLSWSYSCISTRNNTTMLPAKIPTIGWQEQTCHRRDFEDLCLVYHMYICICICVYISEYLKHLSRRISCICFLHPKPT